MIKVFLFAITKFLNFLKVFNFSYLSAGDVVTTKNVSVEGLKNFDHIPFKDIRAKRSNHISPGETLLQSELVGNARVRDLERKVKRILQEQLKCITVNYQES